jgi:hypothetical protein
VKTFSDNPLTNKGRSFKNCPNPRRRVRGDEIISGARILAVADVVEAMTARRPYRDALGLDVALHEIEQGSGRLLVGVDVYVRLFKEHRFRIK